MRSPQLSTKYFVLIVIVLACAALSQVCTANLLTDPGFESFPADASYGSGAYNLYDWRFFSVGGANGTLQVVGNAQEGSRAIKLTRGAGVSDSGLDRDSNKIAAVAGHRYRASVWARSDTATNFTLSLAAFGSSGNWLGIQADRTTAAVGTTWRQYFVEFVAPAGTAQLNFAIRVPQPGSVVFDNCDVSDLTVLPTAPTITYPANETVDSFTPTIAFAGLPHTAYQAIVSNGSGTVWDSGTVNDTGFSLTCPTALAAQGSYSVKVRVQNSVGWSAYSTPSAFTTPAAPTVKITSPAEADVTTGTYVQVNWNSNSPTGISATTLYLDGRVWANLTFAQSYWLWSLTEGMHTLTATVTSAEGTATDTARFYYRAAPIAPAGNLYYYDLSYLWQMSVSDPVQTKKIWDITEALVALQGIVNRSGPRLFIRFWPEDDTWYDRMAGYTGTWLGGRSIVYSSGLNSLANLFSAFRNEYQGAVVWDPNVNATANVALTVAGADNLIPLRYDPTPGSIYDLLVNNGPRIPVQMDLTNKFTGFGTIWQTGLPSTGSKKNDAYVWARTKYLETGKSNPGLLNYAVDGYWIQQPTPGAFPGYALLSRDYVVQNKGFVFDLSVWGDEKPIDDPNQTLGLDLSTLRSILGAAAARATGMIHIVDAKPWPFKYCNYVYGGYSAGGSHEGVLFEWESERWWTAYNAYADADSYAPVDLTNASLWSQYPLPDRLTQNRRASLTELRKQGYIDAAYHVAPLNFLNIYIGDYDAAKWLVGLAAPLWDDPVRGQVPMSWGFDPNLIDRAAAQYAYYNMNRSANDSFIAGDCGSGYVNPSRLLSPRESGLADAKDLWIAHNLKYFRQTNTKMTGFLINGTAGPLGSNADDMFSKFSVDGIFSEPLWYPQGDHMSGSMPAMLMQKDLAMNSTTDASTIQAYGLQGATQFLNFRSVLMSPTYIRDTTNGIKSKDTTIPWATVDAPTYAALMKNFMGTAPDNRATYTFDTLVASCRAGNTISGSIGIRNDGWVTWSASGGQPVTLLVTWKQGTSVVKTQSVPLPRDVPSAGGIVIDAALIAPSAPGSYTLCYEMAKQGVGFSSLGDYAWEKPATVYQPLEGGSVIDVKSYPDGTLVTLQDGIVTAGTDELADGFYVEDEGRISGIKVSTAGTTGISVTRDDKVTIVGMLSVADSGERVLTGPTIVSRTR